MLHPHRILNPSPNRHELREPLVVRQADLSISSRSLPMFKNVNGAVNLTLAEGYNAFGEALAFIRSSRTYRELRANRQLERALRPGP
jgi:hypothetical protein